MRVAMRPVISEREFHMRLEAMKSQRDWSKLVRENRHTTFDHNEAARLYDEGWNTYQLAQKYKKAQPTVYLALKKLGVHFRKPGARS